MKVVAPRNKIAGVLCIVGGALLVVAGTIGMKPLLEEILKYIQPTVDAVPDPCHDLQGADIHSRTWWNFCHNRWPLDFVCSRIGKLLVMLGAGLGLFGFMIS